MIANQVGHPTLRTADHSLAGGLREWGLLRRTRPKPTVTHSTTLLSESFHQVAGIDRPALRRVDLMLVAEGAAEGPPKETTPWIPNPSSSLAASGSRRTRAKKSRTPRRTLDVPLRNSQQHFKKETISSDLSGIIPWWRSAARRHQGTPASAFEYFPGKKDRAYTSNQSDFGLSGATACHWRRPRWAASRNANRRLPHCAESSPRSSSIRRLGIV